MGNDVSSEKNQVDELTLRQAQSEVANYLEAKGEKWTNEHDPFFRLTFLIEEVGELARAVINVEAKTVEPNRRGANSSQEAKLEMVKNELGDILYHIFGTAGAYGIDIQDAFQSSMKTIKTKYPIKTS